jgi:N-acetylmuramoyl-L-alanine amidase
MPLSTAIRRIRQAFLAFCALALLAPAAFAQSGATQAGDPHPMPTVAIAAELSGDGERTELLFILSDEVEARGFVMSGPDRVVVDLPEVNFQIPADAETTMGVVESFRYGLFAPGRSRIVIDLASPASVAAIETRIREEDRAALLTIVLERTDRAAFEDAVARDARAASESAATARAREDVRRPGDDRALIVLDPGHGGIDPGAVARGGVMEKTIVFAFSQRLRERLEETGRYRVVLTREGDVFVSLADRVRIAREAQADLFLSIHADSISSAPQVSGLTIYTGSESASDGESARLADRENQADAAAGIEEVRLPDEITDILQDLTRRETRSFSNGFADRLVYTLDGVARLNRNPRRQAGFRVLRAPDVPSVLVELGYLSSQRDIELLMSEKWRDETTAAMVEAIGQYFKTRFADRMPAAVSP